VRTRKNQKTKARPSLRLRVRLVLPAARRAAGCRALAPVECPEHPEAERLGHDLAVACLALALAADSPASVQVRRRWPMRMKKTKSLRKKRLL
jgi:hypothetical protein